MADENEIRPYVQELMLTLHNDLPRLLRIDRYIHGEHDDPYIPDSAGAEYISLVKRAITNWFPLIIGSSAQSLYVDDVRPGRMIDKKQERDKLPEWQHWEISRLNGRQVSLYEEAIGYGHAFTHTGERGGKIQTKCLSPLKTAAIYSDPANDETPTHAMTIIEWPNRRNGGVGEFSVWDDTDEFHVYFESLGDVENILITKVGPHGSTSCPVTRFAAKIDLVGRTYGVVEPLIALQDRINQTVLDLLVVQSGGAYNVRTVTGMAPPVRMKYEENDEGEIVATPEIDPNTGQPIPLDVQINAKRFLWAESPEVEFGSLPATPIDGFLRAIEDAVKQIAAISQTPPHYLLGSIVNLSAEALQAAETSLERKVMGFRQLFGEAWGRVFRLAGELNGIDGAIDDYSLQVIWRDQEARSLNKTADGLLKLKQLGAPTKGLIEMVPGINKPTLWQWLDWMQEERESATGQLYGELSAVASTRRQARQAPATPEPDRVP